MDIIKELDIIYSKAQKETGCLKVAVGCGIYNYEGTRTCIGVNRVFTDYCKNKGCYRKELYGDDGKEHRLPSDCLAIHAEIDALARLSHNCFYECYSEQNRLFMPHTAIITRYPCEACARALVAAGIREIYYGGEQEISHMTENLFKAYKKTVFHIKDWKPKYDTSR